MHPVVAVADVTPWVGTLTATMGAASLILRSTGRQRLRRHLQRDAEMLEALKATPAQSAMEQVVAHDAAKLRDRVVSGMRLSRNQRRLANAATAIVLGALLGLSAALRPDTTGSGLLRAIYDGFEWTSLALMGAGSLTAGLAIASMVTDWIEDHSDDPGEMGPFGRLLFAPLRLAFLASRTLRHRARRLQLSRGRRQRFSIQANRASHVQPRRTDGRRTVMPRTRDPRITGRHRPPRGLPQSPVSRMTSHLD